MVSHGCRLLMVLVVALVGAYASDYDGDTVVLLDDTAEPAVHKAHSSLNKASALAVKSSKSSTRPVGDESKIVGAFEDQKKVGDLALAPLATNQKDLDASTAKLHASQQALKQYMTVDIPDSVPVPASAEQDTVAPAPAAAAKEAAAEAAQAANVKATAAQTSASAEQEAKLAEDETKAIDATQKAKRAEKSAEASKKRADRTKERADARSGRRVERAKTVAAEKIATVEESAKNRASRKVKRVQKDDAKKIEELKKSVESSAALVTKKAEAAVAAANAKSSALQMKLDSMSVAAPAKKVAKKAVAAPAKKAVAAPAKKTLA